MKDVAIVADSTCCLPPELIEEYGIHLVPLQIVYEGKSYRDGIDITPGEIYKIMRKRENLPTTSNPLAGDFLSTFQKVSQESESILCITVTGLQSKTFEVASLCKQAAEESMPDTAIEVFDSRAVAGAFGFIVLEAARAAKRGASLAEAIETAQNIKGRVSTLFTLDTLYYLARTGRIARAAAWAGAFLNVKPILEHSPSIGETTPLARPRNKVKAIEYMMNTMADRVGDSKVQVMVHHADELEEGKRLLTEICSRFSCTEHYLTEFTPGMGVHTGPGLLGIAFYTN